MNSEGEVHRGLPASLASRLSVPLIAAPMFRVSGPDLVIEACLAGVMGSFPTANCRSVDELNAWLERIKAALVPDAAPYCPNLIMKRDTMQEELACLIRHGVEVVITSVGSPKPAVKPLHDIGCLVLADVATLAHAHKALDAGVDGLILLTAGAGGQTGWANGLSFARAVRKFFDGPLVLAGGISDGAALLAAQVLGCDLGYIGTRFIATVESMASPAYKQMVVDAEFDDILLSKAFTGLETNMLRPSIVAAGLDPAQLPTDMSQDRAKALYGADAQGPTRWRDIWSAGHTVSGVTQLTDVASLVASIKQEYEKAALDAFAHIPPFSNRGVSK